jgi:hypothetical protein
MFFLFSCSTTYHTSAKKRGKQCDCPKKPRVKKNKTYKYK